MNRNPDWHRISECSILTFNPVDWNVSQEVLATATSNLSSKLEPVYAIGVLGDSIDPHLVDAAYSLYVTVINTDRGSVRIGKIGQEIAQRNHTIS